MLYYVEASTTDESLVEDIEASDLDELVQFVQESFARMRGCSDTSEVDVSGIKFTFGKVEDESGNDITDEANDLAEEASLV